MSPYLHEALKLAEIRKGFTAPNPAVGAVLAKNGRIIGKGFHWAAGEPHAEVGAIREAEDVEDATLYVTLEPCCHFGKTPPCTDLILQKKIREVVYGFSDPNPTISGRGVQLLKEAGVKVTQEINPEIFSFYRQYAYWTRTGKTWLTGKLALTNNYQTASLDGVRLEITSERANRYTHERRKQADTLITSQATIQKDDPLFNVRLEDTVLSKPVWIFDRKLKFSLTSKIKQSAHSVSLLCGENFLRERESELKSGGIELVPWTENEGGLELEGLAKELGKRGFHEAWVECGHRLFMAFLRSRRFQEIVLYISNRDYEKGAGPGLELFQELKDYRQKSVNQLGPDRREIWVLENL